MSNEDLLKAHFYFKKHTWKEIVPRGSGYEPISVCECCGLLAVLNFPSFTGRKTMSLIPVANGEVKDHFTGLNKVKGFRRIMKRHRKVFYKYLDAIKDGI